MFFHEWNEWKNTKRQWDYVWVSMELFFNDWPWKLDWYVQFCNCTLVVRCLIYFEYYTLILLEIMISFAIRIIGIASICASIHFLVYFWNVFLYVALEKVEMAILASVYIYAFAINMRRGGNRVWYGKKIALIILY